MRANGSLINRLLLLAVLALLVSPVQTGQVAASEAEPRSAELQPPPPAELLPADGPEAAPPSQAAAAPTTPGINYLTYHSILFQPVRPQQDWEYSFSQGTMHLLSTIQGGQFVLPLALPHGVDVRELTFFFRDNNAASDLSMGICRVPLGDDASFCLQWQVDADGVNTTGVVERTLTGDPILTIDNANYSYFLAAVLPATGSSFGIITARIGYANSTFLPSIQR